MVLYFIFTNYLFILSGNVDSVFVLNSLHYFAPFPVTFSNSFKNLHLVPVLLGMLDVSLFHSYPYIFIYL